MPNACQKGLVIEIERLETVSINLPVLTRIPVQSERDPVRLKTCLVAPDFKYKAFNGLLSKTFCIEID